MATAASKRSWKCFKWAFSSQKLLLYFFSWPCNYSFYFKQQSNPFIHITRSKVITPAGCSIRMCIWMVIRTFPTLLYLQGLFFLRGETPSSYRVVEFDVEKLLIAWEETFYSSHGLKLSLNLASFLLKRHPPQWPIIFLKGNIAKNECLFCDPPPPNPRPPTPLHSS